MARAAGHSASRDGFTLLEVLIVLVIVGLLTGLVLSRGPQRSARLEVETAASDIARTLRLARADAISNSRAVSVVIDPQRRAYARDGGPIVTLPTAIDLRTGDGAGRTRVAIRFAPDGSSSGGSVAVGEGALRMAITVDWLTGRTRLADAR